MPVNIRLAKNGARRKGRIAIGFLRTRSEGLDQQADVVIKKFEVIVNALLSTHRWEIYNHLSAGFPSNRLRCFEVEIRLDQDHLAVLSFHELDGFQGVRRRGRNPRSRLDVPDHIQSEMFSEVRKRAMVRNDLASAIGFHLRVPFLLRLGQPLIEILQTLLEKRAIPRVEISEFRRDASSDPPPIVWIQPIMRIAQRMHVAFRASDCPLWNLQDLGELGCVHIPSYASLDSRISALRDQRRQPANLQLQPHYHQ